MRGIEWFLVIAGAVALGAIAAGAVLVRFIEDDGASIPFVAPRSTAVPAPSTPDGWTTAAEIEATNPAGTLVTLPHPGLYEVSIESGSYTTGTHQRTLVAVFVGLEGPITGCGAYNEPCVRQGIDFYVGDWSSSAPGTPVVRTLNAATLRIVAVDDLGSYQHMNSGSVRVLIREIVWDAAKATN